MKVLIAHMLLNYDVECMKVRCEAVGHSLVEVALAWGQEPRAAEGLEKHARSSGR